jgi:twitching motility protein PilI
MTKKISLREFQEHLAARLAGADQRSAAGLLGILAGADYWLLDLSDSGEIVPLTPLTTVPLTKPWFAGIANIRGKLYSVVDFSAFQGKEATPQNSSARLLLIGTRYGNNAALLVTRMLGLRSVDTLTLAPDDSNARSWARQSYTDDHQQLWKKLNVRALLEDDDFMNVGA